PTADRGDGPSEARHHHAGHHGWRDRCEKAERYHTDCLCESNQPHRIRRGGELCPARRQCNWRVADCGGLANQTVGSVNPETSRRGLIAPPGPTVLARSSVHRWPVGTQQRLVMEFALETASRKGEVVRLGPQHVRNGRIRIERTHGSEDV